MPPCPGTLTCFAGDTLQYLTNDILLSTPHKVRLNTRERFALAYFHEPNFNAKIRPIVSHQFCVKSFLSFYLTNKSVKFFNIHILKHHLAFTILIIFIPTGVASGRELSKAGARVNPLRNALHKNGKHFVCNFG